MGDISREIRVEGGGGGRRGDRGGEREENKGVKLLKGVNV